MGDRIEPKSRRTWQPARREPGISGSPGMKLVALVALAAIVAAFLVLGRTLVG